MFAQVRPWFPNGAMVKAKYAQTHFFCLLEGEKVPGVSVEISLGQKLVVLKSEKVPDGYKYLVRVQNADDDVEYCVWILEIDLDFVHTV